MERIGPRRIVALLVLAAATAGLLFVVYGLTRRDSLDRLAMEGKSRLAIHAESLKNKITRFDYLPAVLATDQDIHSLLHDPADRAAVEKVNRKLALIVGVSEAAQIYVLDADGITRATSNWNMPGSFLGERYAFRPYFRDALQRGQGRHFGVGVTTGTPGYFLSAAVGEGAGLVGAIVVKVDIEALQAGWSAFANGIALSDENGVIVLTNVPDWKYRPIAPLAEGLLTRLSESRQYGASTLSPLSPAAPAGSGAATVSLEVPGKGLRSYRIVAMPIPEFGWTLQYMIDIGQAQRRAGIATALAGLALLACLALFAAWRQRALRLREERDHHRLLEVRIEERTRELNDSNHRLVEEMQERRLAAEALVAAQAEVIQAGKLSALGQMAAAICHEINQPIAAIRTFAKSGQRLAGRSGPAEIETVLRNIENLAQKMTTTTSHLRSFARKSPLGRLEPVNAASITAEALALVDGRIRKEGVRVENRVDKAAIVEAEPIKLEQVMINLITNALDAMDASPRRELIVTTVRAGPEWRIAVSDSGIGLDPETARRMFEPFFTTKQPGKGLGLGLTLSSRIVSDFGGELSACVNDVGGATMTLTLRAHD